MGKTKLKIFVISLIAFALTLVSQVSLAYFSTVGSSSNVVTSGSIKLIIHETSEQGTDLSEGMYITPGDIVSKKVNIENACDHPFYLRVKIVYGISGEELSSDDCFKLNINESLWIPHEDGFYYYNGILQPGMFSENVFSLVEIVGENVDNSLLGKTLTLTVNAQAVQSENNPVEDGKYFEASGWPVA